MNIIQRNYIIQDNLVQNIWDLLNPALDKKTKKARQAKMWVSILPCLVKRSLEPKLWESNLLQSLMTSANIHLNQGINIHLIRAFQRSQPSDLARISTIRILPFMLGWFQVILHVTMDLATFQVSGLKYQLVTTKPDCPKPKRTSCSLLPCPFESHS